MLHDFEARAEEHHGRFEPQVGLSRVQAAIRMHATRADHTRLAM